MDLLVAFAWPKRSFVSHFSKVYTLFDFFKDFERSLMLSKAAFIKKRTLILSNIHVKFQLSN